MKTMIRTYCDICGIELLADDWPVPAWFFFEATEGEDKYNLTVQIARNGVHDSVLCQPCITHVISTAKRNRDRTG